MNPLCRHLAPLAALSALALSAVPAWAANDRVDVEGGYVFAGEPFRLILSGGPLSSAPASTAEQERQYLQPDALDFVSHILVVVQGYALEPEQEYLLSVPMQPKLAGSYAVETEFSQYGTTGARDLATGRVDVFPRVEVDFDPGAIVQEGEALTVNFSALRACPTFPAAGQPLERRGDTFRLAVGDPRCDAALPPSIHTHQATLPADLAPGTYHFDIVTAGAGVRLSRKEFTVAASAPWRVGHGGRFEVEVLRRDGAGVVDRARPVFVPDQPDGSWQSSLLFSFFSDDNWELMLKVLDGCAINNHHWVFVAAASDVEYEITVHDRLLDTTRTYRHAAGEPTPAITDIGAFACN
jgi:hypothetical protein